MKHLLLRILDVAAAAVSATTAGLPSGHPAAALAHLGQPHPARDTRTTQAPGRLRRGHRGRRLSGVPAPAAPAWPPPGQGRPEIPRWSLDGLGEDRGASGIQGESLPPAQVSDRHSWREWAAGPGSRRASAVDVTLGLGSGLDVCAGRPRTRSGAPRGTAAGPTASVRGRRRSTPQGRASTAGEELRCPEPGTPWR